MFPKLFKQISYFLFLILFAFQICGCHSWGKTSSNQSDILEDRYNAKKVRDLTYVKRGNYHSDSKKVCIVEKDLRVDKIYKGNKVLEIILTDSTEREYEVISISCQMNCKGEKIREGKIYHFKLVPCYNIPEHTRCQETTRPIVIGEYLVMPAHLLFQEIYITNNLCGLIYRDEQ